RQRAAEQRRLRRLQGRYTAQIARAVEGHWRRPSGTPDGLEAVVRVSFSAAGAVRRVEILSGSGHPGFDHSVERAVRRASPVPFPEEPALRQRMQTITFRFAPDRS
ncbi:energy transducer TonB, partial [Halorhodospira neutriphila]